MSTIVDNSGNDHRSPARPHEDDTRGLGELLRSARERRGLSLEQVSNETKIPRRHLEALERDNLTAVPGGFYRRAQLRTFAQAVNLDQNLALARLERMLAGPAVRETGPVTPAAHAPTSSRSRVLILVGVGVAAVVLVRSIGRPPLPGRDGPERAATESPRQETAAQGPETIGDAVVAVSQRAPLDPVPPQSAVSEDPLAVATERPEARAGAVSDRDAGANKETTKPVVAASPFTELIVTTQPPGARVTVNGIGWGSSPTTIRFLPAGSKRIRVVKDGYGSEERVVNVVEGHRNALDIRLGNAP
jgi:cytoskeletal protein RodZ